MAHVGGRIVEVIQKRNLAWVATVDPNGSEKDVVWVLTNPAGNMLKAGDSFWWHGACYWTPKPPNGRVEVELAKLSASTDKRPE